MDAATRFRALFESHHGAVRRYAHHRAIVGADADDLVAEVFTVAWRRLATVPTDDALPWLLAVAGNVRRNQARSARRYAAVLVALPRPETGCRFRPELADRSEGPAAPPELADDGVGLSAG